MEVNKPERKPLNIYVKQNSDIDNYVSNSTPTNIEKAMAFTTAGQRKVLSKSILHSNQKPLSFIEKDMGNHE